MIHIIPNLKNGGAENVLVRLCLELQNRKNDDQVILSIQDPSFDFNYPLVKDKIKILSFEKNQDYCLEIVKNDHEKPIILWMYPAIYFYHRWKLGKQINNKIYWNIRHSDFGKYALKQKLFLYVFGLASRILPVNIIYCSKKSEETHTKFWFTRNNTKVIINRLAKTPPQELYPPTDLSSYILFVGRYNSQKGPNQLKKIAKAVLLKDPKLSLIILGRGWNTSIFDENIQSQIILKSSVNNVFDYYRFSKALLYTSQFGEGYPNVIAEAMSVGASIVGFDAGDYKYMTENYPQGFLAESVSNFIEILQTVLSSPSENFKKIELSNSVKKELNFEKTVDEYYEHLSSREYKLN